MENIHATSVDMNGSGILIVGPSSSGKSDLALRLIENKGAVLVADDRTDLLKKDGQLIASCPKNIEGLLEVRGIGIVHQVFKNETCVKLVVWASGDKKTERYPTKKYFENQGVKVEGVELNLLEASAVDKVVVKLKSILEEEKQKT
ncbi:MAG: HPr kinase/phosphatase C-terminal domain-containing protein [Alphaproteobacteria bacterium]|nr:HPr kinase/phosphatase C-terminal domain-containing protein [Alphaproteobacteria bacterium]